MTQIHIDTLEVLELSRSDWEAIVRALKAQEQDPFTVNLIRDIEWEIIANLPGEQP